MVCSEYHPAPAMHSCHFVEGALMPTRTRDLTAQKRPRRARSRAISTLPSLVVSSLKPHEVDLAYSTLVCPTCRTWVPINAPHSERPKLVPHHTEKVGTED